MIFSRKLTRDKGVSGIEYGLIAGFLSLVIMSSVAMTGTDTKQTFCAVEKGLTGTYSGDCAQARLVQIRSLMAMFDMQISTAQTDENNILGLSGTPDSDEQYEQDKAQAVSDLQGDLTGWQNQLTSDQNQLTYLQGVLATETENNNTIGIAKTNNSIKSTQQSIDGDNKMIASDQKLIDEYNNDELNITRYYDEQGKLAIEESTLKGSSSQ